jgi:hypothetical protein
VASVTCCRRSCRLSSCCDRFPDAYADAAADDDIFFFGQDACVL